MKETGPNGYANKLRNELLNATGLILKKWGNHMEGKGWPDLYVPSPIWHGWIEVKVGSNRTSDAQRRKIRLLNACRVPVVVMRWLDGVERIEDGEGRLLRVRTGVGGKGLLFELRELFE